MKRQLLAVSLLASVGAASPINLPVRCCDLPPPARVAGSSMMWPAPPERPRVEYLAPFVSEASMGKGEGTLSRLRRFFTGADGDVLALQRPHDAVVDSRDRIYVTDGARRSVLVFDPASKSAHEIGTGSGPGRLSKPMGLGVDSRDALYVADQGGKRVVVFKADGTFQSAFGGESILLNPVDVAVDPSTGVVYVADSYLHQVIAFNPDGSILRRLGRNKGDLSAKRRSAMRTSGVAHDPQSQAADSAECCARGNAATAAMDSAMRTVLGHAGKYLAESRDLVENRGSAPGEFRYPSFLAVGGDGTLYVSDALNFRVQMFDRGGRFVGQIGRLGDSPGSFARPKGVAVDSDGHVYVADAAFNNVQVFDRLGSLLLTFASMGRGTGEVVMPLGVFIDRHHRVLVCDRFNNRVQFYHYLTEAEGDAVLVGHAPTH